MNTCEQNLNLEEIAKFDLIYRFVRECENFYAQRNMDRKQNVKQISMIEENVLFRQNKLHHFVKCYMHISSQMLEKDFP